MHPPPELPRETIHLSFEPGPYRMAMGLFAQPASALIELDDRYPDEMAQRRQLLAERHGEVFAALPAAADACREALQVIADNLTTHYPAWFSHADGVLLNHITGETWDLAALPCDPLEVAGRLVQEDLCLIQPSADGPILAAAVLCFPSRWRLMEKFGRPLATVHAAVPFYAERLATPVDRFMNKVKPGHIASRLNWSILDDATLFQPTGKWRTEANAAITPDNAGDTLFLRVERQTLSRLPRCGFVLFGIRVHVYPLAHITACKANAAQLAEAVRALPDEVLHYKSVGSFRPALLAYLDTRSG
jgi:dimethylamine monooxygenase subunit A